MSDPEPLAAVETPRTSRREWLLTMVATLTAALLGLALWLALSWWIRIPLAIYPLGVGALIAFIVHMTFPLTGKGPALCAAILSGIFSLLGTSLSTIVLSRPDNPSQEAWHNTMAYLQSPGRFKTVVSASLTPMDLIMVLAAAGGSYYLVILLARRSAQNLPVGESVDSVPSSIRERSQESEEAP